MKKILFTILFFYSLILSAQQSPANIPRLVKNGKHVQLIVDDKPFLVFGGELGNSTASSNEYMRPIWPKLKQMNLNTVLAPVYWELMEPIEGKFDFSLVDSLVRNARLNSIKVILLWFGAWKNSMSCYGMGWSPGSKENIWPLAGALIISVAPDEFFVAGTGIVMTFASTSQGKRAGFISIDDGRFENEKWIPGRRMNGDQDHQGRHVRIPVNDYSIHHVKLYTY